MRIVESNTFIEGYRQSRTHKKKRINKKWLKKYGVKAIPDENIYITGDTAFCHPRIAAKIKRCFTPKQLKDTTTGFQPSGGAVAEVMQTLNAIFGDYTSPW